MRRPLLAIAFFLFSTTAAAAVSEPDGVVVPKASADPVQLNTFFAGQGEAIDWKTEAASSPNSFSPLCGFTATFMLHGADCPLDFAWYNETGSPPAASDLHIVIPAGAPVGTSITGTSIKGDPSYLGGLVGFALVGKSSQFCTQSHYSNPKWNQNCSGCVPPAPWITTLIYPSKKTTNAFYLAFEDGPTSTSSFNNDGDFNDDVYFVSGVTCVGGGQPCDTGQLGICATGITQCNATGTFCKQVSPSGKEKCNGVDDDCNGQADEGDICPTGLVCDKGACVQKCQSGEFACPNGKVCGATGHCVDPGCQNVSCDAGKVCVAGKCKAPCDGVVCPHSQVCRVGACVDPCAGVTCGAGMVCDTGICVAKCDCLPCAGANKACLASTGLCIDAACAGVTCAAGKHCESGKCVAACEGVVCPTGQACNSGQCLDIPQPDGGADGGGSSSSGGLVGNPIQDAGTVDGGEDLAWATKPPSSGCGCSVVSDSTGGTMAVAGAALALAVLGRRRARKRRRG